MPTRQIADIKVGSRVRKDVGDIERLASSITRVGLLHPVVVTEDGALVAGYRRIKAAHLLGWTDIPVTVARNIDDALTKLQAERDENEERKAMTLQEKVSQADVLEPLERKAAKERQAAAGPVSGKGAKRSGSGKSPEPVPGGHGDARDKLARALDTSAPTLAKARAVVEAAQKDPKKFGPILARMNEKDNAHGAWKELKRREKEDLARALDEVPVAAPLGPFHVLVVDPPWPYEKRAEDVTHRGACPYPSMSIEEIEALPIDDHAATDAVLWLWTTNAFMRQAFVVLDAWGFKEKTILTWVKDRMGVGDWLRGRTEHCIMAVKGHPTVTLTNETTVLEAKMREHSRKPEEFFSMVERLCHGARLEMFARERRDGWTAWGAEVGKF